jgi:NAD dependent epimerase/dehydratase family enzyme
MGEFGNVILKGQKVLPRRLLEKGFPFQFPNLKEALEDLLQMQSERNPRGLMRDERANAK